MMCPVMVEMSCENMNTFCVKITINIILRGWKIVNGQFLLWKVTLAVVRMNKKLYKPIWNFTNPVFINLVFLFGPDQQYKVKAHAGQHHGENQGILV